MIYELNGLGWVRHVHKVAAVSVSQTAVIRFGLALMMVSIMGLSMLRSLCSSQKLVCATKWGNTEAPIRQMGASLADSLAISISLSDYWPGFLKRQLATPLLV